MLQSGLFGDLFRDAAVAQEFGFPAFLSRMVLFERAWTEALRDTGALGPYDAAQAIAALERYDPATFTANSDIDGLPVPALVAHLRSGLSASAARGIHSGATSQDVIDTAMVLTGLAVLDLFETRIGALLDQLQTLETRFGAAPLMARTRMQAALPATVALRLNSWRRGLEGQGTRLRALREELAQVQIGGAIGQRDVPASMVALIAERLGLRAGPVWHSERAAMVAFGHFMVLLSGTMGKIAQDIALMAQQGVDEIALSGGGGSSAMPHKQNPVLAEITIALARHVAGQQGTLSQAMIHEQERSGAAWALEWLTLPAMAEATGASLRHVATLLASTTRLGSLS